MGCNNCSNITLPQGSVGPAGPTGATGANGTNGLDGASLLGTKFNRPSTSAITLSEITNIPIDVSEVFSTTGDAIEFEVVYSFDYISGTDGGNIQLSLEENINTLPLFSNMPLINNDGFQSVIVQGTIVRASNTSINYSLTVFQPASAVYSSPKSQIGNIFDRGNWITVTNPGTIDNTSANLKLSAKGIVYDGNNNIKVEFFKVKAIKLI
jgi:hypothetical protein